MPNINSGKFILDHTLVTQAVTGIGFKPSAIIFYAMNNSVTSNGVGLANTHGGMVYGFATNDGEQCFISTSRQGGSDNGAAHRDYSRTYAMQRRPSASYGGMCGEAVWWGAVDGAFTVQSFDNDGFTIYNDIDFCSNWRVFYLAINAPLATIVHFDAATAVGNQSLTGVGFPPGAVFSMHGNSTTVPAYLEDCMGGLGFSDGTNSACWEVWDNHLESWANCWHSANNSEIFNIGVASRAEMVSFDDDGFTINWVENSGSAYKLSMLCLGGVEAHVGDINIRTDTVDTAETGVGFQPDGLVLFTNWGHNVPNGTATSYYNHFGTTTGITERGCIGYAVIHSWRPPDCTYSSYGNQILDQSSDQIQRSKMDLVSLDEDGFTFKMDQADSVTKFTNYIALKVIEYNYRDRLVRYLHNTHQSGKLGRASFRDIVGREVPPHQLEVDNWAFSGGALFPTPVKYENMLEDPNAFYFESLKPKDTEVQVETDRESFFESIMRKLGAR